MDPDDFDEGSGSDGNGSDEESNVQNEWLNEIFGILEIVIDFSYTRLNVMLQFVKAMDCAADSVEKCGKHARFATVRSSL